MKVKIYSLNYVDINNKREEILLPAISNLYELKEYYNFIKKLIFMSYKKNNYLNKVEYTNLVFYTFIYYLLNWDNILHTNQIPFHIWKNFRNVIKDLLDKDNVEFILNYKYANISYIENFLKSYGKKVKREEKNIFIDYIIENFQDKIIMTYFLIRKLFLNKKLNFNLYNNKCNYVLFITDYDRYYENNRFFGEHLFNDKRFKKLIRCNDFDNLILYTKYTYTNFKKYINDYFKKDSNILFIEDLLDLKLGLKILFSKNIYKNFHIQESNVDKQFIIDMFNIFLKNKLPFILWFYLSIKKFVSNINIKYIVGDSEKNFIFYLFNIYKLSNNSNIKTIAFSHELITKNYLHPIVSKEYECIPDYKLVWNHKIKELLVKIYKFPENRVLVFPDPRFLYWKNLSKENKSILLISQGFPEFYEMIFKAYNEGLINNLVNKGYTIYFKPHPAEFNFKLCVDNFKKLKTLKKIRIIHNISFLPEYAIGMFSTLLYELYTAGSKIYFLDKKAKDTFIIDDKEFKKIYKNNLKSALLNIIEGKKG